MLKAENLVRENIKNLKAYSSARDEYSGKDAIFLDANEKPYGEWNRYPDPFQKLLKERIGKLWTQKPESIFIGNGSDEIIDLLLRCFVEPMRERLMACTPSYGMYEVSAAINAVEVVEFKLDQNFEIDPDDFLAAIKGEEPKMIILCSPNNPTGNTIPKNLISKVAKSFQGLLVVDEAYIDFCEEESCQGLLKEFGNLVVLRTLSKAWGLAGARLGFAFADPAVIEYLNKVKPPYNVSALNQKAAFESLNKEEELKSFVSEINLQRNYLNKELAALKSVEKVYPSKANFILIKVKKAGLMYEFLIEKGLVVRNRNSLIENCLRVSIGSPTENELLVMTLKEFEK
jgi:histidinol-phosphate aminotransferase